MSRLNKVEIGKNTFKVNGVEMATGLEKFTISRASCKSGKRVITMEFVSNDVTILDYSALGHTFSGGSVYD